jgi:hypothetical protein
MEHKGSKFHGIPDQKNTIIGLSLLTRSTETKTESSTWMCILGWSGHFSNRVSRILWVLKLLVLIQIDTMQKIFEIGED